MVAHWERRTSLAEAMSAVEGSDVGCALICCLNRHVDRRAATPARCYWPRKPL